MTQPPALGRKFRTALRRGANRAARAAMVLAVLALTPLVAADPAAANGTSNNDAFNNIGPSWHANWMASVPGDTSLSDMSIPGTHETLALHGGEWVQTQQNYGDSAATLTTQLQRGIRAIDIRVRVIGGKFAIHHGSYYQNANFDDVLTKARAFLSAYPSETILMRLHSECTGQTGSCTDDPSTVDQSTRETIFNQYVAQYSGLFYGSSVVPGHPTGMPTLNQARGKIVLTSFEGPQGGDYGYGISGYNDNKEDAYSVCNQPQKWSAVQSNLNQAAQNTNHSTFVTYTSANCVPYGTFPANVAGGFRAPGVNIDLMNYLNSGGGNGGHLGVVMMDFPGWALMDDIIYRNRAPITSGIPGYCLDDYAGNGAAGAKVDAYACNGTAPQMWTIVGNTVRTPAGMCLDVRNAGTANGNPVELWNCNGFANQQWVPDGKHELVNPASGRCLDVPGWQTGGTQLDIWDCQGSTNEQWLHA
ncbi:hypothetical protein P3T37_004795 [Kitasatospora sp. MAA4]|uniref:phosphatidylinositol-specific phospholipase C domain-containing protein n=1 Tax=Kitasatospora sp. MAA4 TaxID=3035093 RepID=UPI0024734DA2|nr:phosphatidylinositol-specific phospholipase C domain-containing protein [Kitasatospora sp. MAA4]MDH6135380.1 hypothetical protein [Kitasatospora sp. MAA4]